MANSASKSNEAVFKVDFGRRLILQFPNFVPRHEGALKVFGGQSGEAQDLWLANGEARPLSANACGYGENDPFAAFKNFDGAG